MNPLKDVVKPLVNPELLPFVVEVASEEELGHVAALRANAYGKHLPQIARDLSRPEPYDYEFGCEVFVARSKLDGTLLGSLRTHANVMAHIPLQASIALPEKFEGQRMVEATRLCIQGNAYSSLVRSALFKALFQYCEMQGVEWIMAAGRKPVDRLYDSLMFSDVAEPRTFYPMAHAGNVPHRVMSLSVRDARQLWLSGQHPLYKFVIETSHPDIRVESSLAFNFSWACPDGPATGQAAKDFSMMPGNALNGGYPGAAFQFA